jgi:pre-rRNA-processing protein TSR4
MNALFPFQGAAGGDSDEDKEGDDSDADLEQEDLNRILTGKDRRQRERTVRHDATTEAFYDRIHLNGGDVRTQCLRYCRWNDDAVLWMRDENQVRDVPVCQRCGAPRKFEFQLMPQLLYYLQQEDARSSSSHKDNGLSKVKAAMEQAESWIEQAPPELVSPGLVEARDGTARAVQNHLLSSSKSADWGVVAVYTCTGSCNHPASPLACVTAGAPSPELGAYVEEYAWVQPSLDH